MDLVKNFVWLLGEFYFIFVYTLCQRVHDVFPKIPE